jgi:hypothetical protein
MKVVFTSIYSRFNTGTNSLKTAVGGRMYPHEAADAATMPYVVYYLVDDLNEYTFSDDTERINVQFSIYSDSNSPGQALDLYENLKSLYDDAALTVTGYTVIRCQRGQMQLMRDEEMGTWHLFVDYEIEIERERS